MADLLLNMPMQYEPQRQNRFLIRFPDDLGIQSFMVSTAQRPKININKTEIPFLNTSTFVAGRYIWQPLQITLKDAIGPSTAQSVMEWIRLTAESVTGRMGYAAGYARNLELVMLDPTGVVCQKWIIVGAIITDQTDFGQLNYNSDALAEITINIQPQYCILAY